MREDIDVWVVDNCLVNYSEIDNEEDVHDEVDDFDNEDQFPVIGTCRALYHFDGKEYRWLLRFQK